MVMAIVEREGKLDSHEIRHVLAAAVSDEIFRISNEQPPPWSRPVLRADQD